MRQLKVAKCLQQSTPSNCSIHKRLGAGVFASGPQAVSCLTELMVFYWRLLRVEGGSTPTALAF
jgi:hypothetical protein